MTMMPLGRRVAVYEGLRGWTAAYFITESAPSRAAAQAAVDVFTTPYSAGWHDALADLLVLWRDAKAWDGEKWSVARVGTWIRGAVERLAPGVGGV